MSHECERVQGLLIDYMEGELAERERASIDVHLAACTECAAERDGLARAFAALRTDGYREPSPFYWTRFDAALRRRLGASRGASAAGVRTGLAPKLAPVAVAACCFAVGLWLGLRPSLQGPGGVSAIPVASAPQMAHGIPVVSPESKLLVEAGLDRHPVYAADTLRPNTFAPFGESPDVVLASSPRLSVIEPGLGQRSPGR